MARPAFDSHDFEKNRLTGALGYICFIVPLIACPNSRFGKFCLNQGVWGCIVYAAAALLFALLNTLLGWVPVIGWLIGAIGFLVKAALVLTMLWYAWNAYNGKAEPLPFVGGITLIR